MKQLITNIVLAVIWAAVTGTISLGNLVIGFILGYIVMLIAAPAIDTEQYTRRIRLGVVFVFYFIKELVVSSLRVAKDVIKPGFSMQSGIVAIPMDCESDLEKTLLANFISLTPGTLSVDIPDGGNTLYIHAMYIDNGDIDAVVKEIKNGMERHILEITRPDYKVKY
ncbi:MAG: Na+/H+ antiporter subunit E [Balneolia bacterium]|nr:Na+/H+ antiporter subunit E [Balneolia bacterium]